MSDKAHGFNRSEIVDVDKHIKDYAPESHFLPFWFYADSGDVFDSIGNHIGSGRIENEKLVIE